LKQVDAVDGNQASELACILVHVLVAIGSSLENLTAYGAGGSLHVAIAYMIDNGFDRL
jgi:hypothetical protein